MVASHANTFGSATSSVCRPHHPLWQIPSAGITTQATYSTAILNALLADILVMLFCLHCSFTDASNGILLIVAVAAAIIIFAAPGPMDEVRAMIFRRFIYFA